MRLYAVMCIEKSSKIGKRNLTITLESGTIYIEVGTLIFTAFRSDEDEKSFKMS
jgi:hypothetical protein